MLGPHGGPAPGPSGFSAPSAWSQQRPVGVARGSSIMKATQPTSHPQRPPAPAALGRATSHRDVPVAEAAPGGKTFF